MQDDPYYQDVVAEVCEFLFSRKVCSERAGINSDRICLDPGFGFGKTLSHNYQILARLHEMHALGSPLLVGISRKSMIGSVTGGAPADRLAGSLAGGDLAGSALPVDTHLFLNGEAPDEIHEKLQKIAAVTCYLHASLAAGLEPQVEVELNGEPLR
jgi:hypothetical protein